VPGVEVGIVGAHRRADGIAPVGGWPLAQLVLRDESRPVPRWDVKANSGEGRGGGLARLPRCGDVELRPAQVLPGPAIA